MMVGVEDWECCLESKPALSVAVYAAVGRNWNWLVLSWVEFFPSALESDLYGRESSLYIEGLFLCVEVFFPCAAVFFPCVEVFFLCEEVFFACGDICPYDQEIYLLDGVCRNQGNFENLFFLFDVVCALSHHCVKIVIIKFKCIYLATYWSYWITKIH